MTLEERKVLEARYNAGQSVPGIANAMGFSFSTVSKELKQWRFTGKMDKKRPCRVQRSAGTTTALQNQATPAVSSGLPGGAERVKAERRMEWMGLIVTAGVVIVLICAGIFELLERRKRAALEGRPRSGAEVHRQDDNRKNTLKSELPGMGSLTRPPCG